MQAVLELSLLRHEPCRRGRGEGPVHDQPSHRGWWELLFWALCSCWLALAVRCVIVLAYGFVNVLYARRPVLFMQ